MTSPNRPVEMIYLAAIKLEWWPGSDWNMWPPSSESAQALAVFELLDELREKIWTCYGSQMQDLMAEQQQYPEIGDSDGSVIP